MIAINNSLPFNTNYFKDYYHNYRNKYEDLFSSEKYFFNQFLEGSSNVLDVGSASGGMYEIITNLFNNISYRGVDISSELIEEAKKRYPDGLFSLIDGKTLPFSNDQFDSVLSFGTTVHESNWKNLISECYRVAKKKILIDIRLTNNPTINSLNEGYVQDGSNIKYPYVVINFNECLEFLKNLKNLENLSIYGYFGKANEDTTLPTNYNEIIMASILIQKSDLKANSEDNQISLKINLPKDFLV